MDKVYCLKYKISDTQIGRAKYAYILCPSDFDANAYIAKTNKRPCNAYWISAQNLRCIYCAANTTYLF